MAKACASHGSRNTGPPSASRGRAASLSNSGRLKIRLPKIRMHVVARWVIFAPELLSREAHRVEPLRVVPAAGSARIGKHVGSICADDLARMATQIARQTRMAFGV